MNFYTIAGCSFGNVGPNAQVYIFYQGTFHEQLQVQEWSDNLIEASLNPKLTGVDDQQNVTLVVQRQDGTQASKSGFKFYAERQTVLLRPIPRQYFALNQFRPDNMEVHVHIRFECRRSAQPGRTHG